MTSSSESASAVLGLFLLLQLVGFLALLLGGMYLLFCLQRAANGLDRLASVAEEWLRRQPANPPVSGTVPPSYPANSAYLPAGNPGEVAPAASAPATPPAAPPTL